MPDDHQPVWAYNKSTKKITMGYYRQQIDGWFDSSGTGIAVTHWANIVPPDLPNDEDLD